MNQLSLIKSLINADVPVLLWGPAGVGKTSALLALAGEETAHVEVLIGSTVDPTDVGGYLVPDSNGQVRSSPPPWARRLYEALRAGQPAWLVLDELSCAPPSVQAALLRVVQERRVGELDISGCRVVAAANPADMAADGGSISGATANRWAHLEWVVDAKAWVIGELSGWGKAPSNAKLSQARASITGFIQKKPSALLAPPTDGAKLERAWPSPRSWSAAARALAFSSKDTEVAAVRACVGAGAAAEWDAWRLDVDLPDPEDILYGRAKIPTRGDRAHAALAAMVAAAGSDHRDRDKRLNMAWGILSEQRPDLAVSPAAALLELSGGEVPDEARDLGQRIHRVQVQR